MHTSPLLIFMCCEYLQVCGLSFISSIGQYSCSYIEVSSVVINGSLSSSIIMLSFMAYAPSIPRGVRDTVDAGI